MSIKHSLSQVNLHEAVSHMFGNVLLILLHHTSPAKEEPAEVDGRVVSSDIHQLQQNKKPLDALRIKSLQTEFTLCPQPVECVQKV